MDGGKVARSSDRVLQPGVSGRPWTEVRTRPQRSSAADVVRTLVKWLQTTRLVTRTKESNMHASVWASKPERGMKVNTRVGVRKDAPSTGPEGLIRTDLSRSTYVGTREMVNYPCLG